MSTRPTYSDCDYDSLEWASRTIFEDTSHFEPLVSIYRAWMLAHGGSLIRPASSTVRHERARVPMAYPERQSTPSELWAFESSSPSSLSSSSLPHQLPGPYYPSQLRARAPRARPSQELTRTPYSRPSTSAQTDPRPARRNPNRKSQYIYELVFPEDVAGTSQSEPIASTSRLPLVDLRLGQQPPVASSQPYLRRKDTGEDVTYLLRSWSSDRFSTRKQRLDDGSQEDLLDFWWCRNCNYHSYRSPDMDIHVLQHREDAVPLFNCKAFNPPCPCDSHPGGFESIYKKSVVRHYRKQSRKETGAGAAPDSP